MNSQQIQGRGQHAVGKAKVPSDPLTDEDLEITANRRAQLAGTIQARHGVALQEAGKQLAQWQRKTSGAWFKAADTPQA